MMDFYEARDNFDEIVFEQNEPSVIQEVYEGATVFITGASGFMGRVLMEKLLRTCNLAQIYILMRDKKGVKCQDRLSALFDDPFFEPLKLEKPGELKKVTLLSGDCSLPGLGLSELDKNKMAEVNIIFHAAATLHMDQHLKVAYNTNVLGTKILLEFAKSLSKLKAFMYVSTAYTHAYKDLVEEKFYDVVFDEEELGEICSQLDEAQIGALTPKLTGKWNNTYALTKAYAEYVIATYDKILPIGVVRPSVVVPTQTEPLQAWINNIYGVVGVVMGTAMGIIRVWCANGDFVGDMIPVDMAINMTLVATWEIVTKNNKVKIYNCVSSPFRPITWDLLKRTNMFTRDTTTTDTALSIAYPEFCFTKNKLLFWIYTIWYHVIPGFFMDLFLQVKGKSPMLLKIYAKVYSVNILLAPYCAERAIEFAASNIMQLWNNLSPLDRQLFNFDFEALNWTMFWFTSGRGLRVYIAKDPMETLPEGRRHVSWLRLRDRTILIIEYLAVAAVVYFYFREK